MITIEQARLFYLGNDAAHDFDHVLRVLHLAERIATQEGADLEIVRTAALLHDIGRAEQERTGRCHALVGAQMARQILANYPADRVEAVAQAIAQHRYRAKNPPSSLEAQVLYDADKLDAMGAIGVARAYAFAGAQGQRLWAEVDTAYALRAPEEGKEDHLSGEHTPVHEYLFKLSRLKDFMLTQTGRLIAQERHAYMEAFFKRLALEIKGEL